MAQSTEPGNSLNEIRNRLMTLARETGTDVEGVVSWLASSYSPNEAFEKLLT
jgi:hypothetical protein